MQKVAILGFGSEGLSAYRFFKAQGADITVFDEKASPNQKLPDDVKFVVGREAQKDLRGYDVIVRFPAINPKSINTDGQITSVTKEFFKACPAPIIGVTGTKGKGTVSSLIHDMLNAAGIRAHLAGNIGVPMLDILPDVKPDDVVVLELSSFQLWDLTQSPHVAVVLMVEQEHLNIHDGMDDYLAAKSNITKWQKQDDITVYLPDNEFTGQIAMQGPGQKIPYTKAPGAFVQNGNFIMDDQVICSIQTLKLPGQHNLDNTCAAITATWQFTQQTTKIAEAIGRFEGLEHRLKFVREVNNVKYYDDNYATTPTSAVASLKSFDRPKVIILGGSDKGSDYSELGWQIAKSKMRSVILIGQMRDKLKQAIDAAGYTGDIVMFDTDSTMTQIVQAAAAKAQAGDAVVMSPACASFDMFKNYKDRGQQYIAAVNSLAG